MKALDILLLVILIWGAYSGFKKGFIAEVFSLGAFLLATIGSVKLLNQLTSLFKKWYGSLGDFTPYIVFVLIFITIVILVTLIGKLFRNLVNMTILGGLDKLMGAILGIFKWAFFVSTFLWLANLLHVNLVHSYLVDTFFFPLIKSLAPRFLGWLADWIPVLQGWIEGIQLIDYKRVLV
ncbi:MAG: hypothetical protein BGO68_03920 [Candidatus Amoebophilus sp. 36-38]|nr:MAG: hypothetical protein BGO68_03920 [Candidatus Amoebophilus sp. 36-38]